uniref:Uncharacterized protein n=1 Tax=Rhodnius prolixus TaxID=13249 RepID=T1HHH9_RHOPR
MAQYILKPQEVNVTEDVIVNANMYSIKSTKTETTCRKPYYRKRRYCCPGKRRYKTKSILPQKIRQNGLMENVAKKWAFLELILKHYS